MEKKVMTFIGKYAEQRREVLENHAPEMYEAMLEEGMLREHLENVQNVVSEYVERAADRFRASDEYRKAEEKDPFEAMRLLNMTVLEAENAAFGIWIGVIPESENEEEDENE